MNYSIIIYIIGVILKIEAAFMALPAVTALIYRETSGIAFVITILLCLAVGFPLTRKKPTKKAFYRIELDCSEYHGCSSICHQQKHPESCRCTF